MSTQLNNHVTMLMCDDVQASIAFYTDALGFSVKDRMDDVGKTGWACLTHGTISLMLASPHFAAQPIKVAGRYPQAVNYFYPEDVAALHELLTARGYEVGQLETKFYGMTEFEMLDPSGHVLVFGQELESR